MPPGLPVLGVVPPQMPCMRSCSNANSWRTGHPVQVDLAFAICSRARPVDEIGKNRSGSACAHALASRQSAPSRGRHSAFLTGERVIPRNERAASRQRRFMQAAWIVPAFTERAGFHARIPRPYAAMAPR